MKLLFCSFIILGLFTACAGDEPTETEKIDTSDSSTVESEFMDTLETDEFGNRTRIKGDTVEIETRIGCLFRFSAISESEFQDPSNYIHITRLRDESDKAVEFEPEEWSDGPDVGGTITKEYKGTLPINNYHVYLEQGDYEDGGYRLTDFNGENIWSSQFSHMPSETPDGRFIFQNTSGYGGYGCDIFVTAINQHDHLKQRYIVDYASLTLDDQLGTDLHIVEIRLNKFNDLFVKIGDEYRLEDSIRDEEQFYYYRMEYDYNFQDSTFTNESGNLVDMVMVWNKWVMDEDLNISTDFNTDNLTNHIHQYYFDKNSLDTICPKGFHPGTRKDWSNLFFQFHYPDPFFVDLPDPVMMNELEQRGIIMVMRGFMRIAENGLKEIVDDKDLVKYWYKDSNGQYKTFEIDREGKFTKSLDKENEGYCVKCFLDQ